MRKAQPADCEALVRFIIQMGYKYTTTEMLNRIQQFNCKNHYLWVALKAKQILGCVAFTITEHFLHNGKCCYIDTLIIDENARGQAIGTLFLNRIEEFAVKKQCITLELITANHRREKGTHHFYEKHGFQNHEMLDFSYYKKKLGLLR